MNDDTNANDRADLATPTHRALVTLPTAAERESFLRQRLRLSDPAPAPLALWIGLGIVTLFALITRVAWLSHPHSLVFDETYYVKDAYSLQELGYAGKWGEDPNPKFIKGDVSSLEHSASFVVHPDVGKWLIALGIRAFGVESSFGWRIAVALAGVISVWLLGRITARLFRSTTVAVTAAALLAMDGIHLVETRIALLDAFVMLFALAGFWALLRDRDRSRADLARIVAKDPSCLNDPWGPRLWWRPWLLVAGVLLGLGIGVKWSGLYALAAFGLTAFAWDVSARRAVGCRLWVGAGVFRGGLPAFVNLVPVAFLTYLASWFSWFTHRESYYRQWAQGLRDGGHPVPRAWLPDVLNNLLEYHLATYRFHVGLHSDHTYQSNPFGWLLQIRPTSFYWQPTKGGPCTWGGECTEAILAVGNPAIWWPAAIGLLVVLWAAVMRRDWRAWAIIAGYAGLYLPWLMYLNRTIFTFYTIAFVPFVVLAWVYALGVFTGHIRPVGEVPFAGADGTIIYPDAAPRPRSVPGSEANSDADYEAVSADNPETEPTPAPDDKSLNGAPVSTLTNATDPAASLPRRSKIIWFSAVAVVALMFVYFLPIWTGMQVPTWFWRSHMWLSSWI